MKKNTVGYLGDNDIYPDYPHLRENARSNRLDMTDAEKAMWSRLRNNQLGVRFRRQHVIGDYIVDFVCLRKHLVIEVDGGYHYTPEQQQDDVGRTNYLIRAGYRVIRFANGEVEADIDRVVRQINNVLQ